MERFTDNKGREYTFNLTIRDFLKVNSVLNVNLFNPQDKDDKDVALIAYIYADDLYLIPICETILDKQLKDKGLTIEEFEEAIGGENLASMAAAFQKEYKDFFIKRKSPLTEIFKAIEQQL